MISWKALFWPQIRNDLDLDNITGQGFWICLLVAAITFFQFAIEGSYLPGALDALFFVLGGIGVRQRSALAALEVMLVYLLSGLVVQKYAGNGFSVLKILFLVLLLANFRGCWLAAQWPRSELPQLPLNTTFRDKLSRQLPAALWPNGRWLFYILGAGELVVLAAALFTPKGT